MQRRDFLRALGVAGAAGTWPAGPAHAAPSILPPPAGSASSAAASRVPPQAADAARPAASPRTLKKAVMLGMVGPGATIAEKFRLIKECGFTGVEVDWPGPLAIDDLRRACDDTGLAVHGLVHSLHWKYPLNHPDDAVRSRSRAALEECLRAGQKLGASSVLLVPAVVNADLPYDQAWEISQREIIAALPLAQESGVIIAIENVWNNFLLSPLEAVRYVDQLASPWARFHFDIGNVINFGWPEQWVRLLGPRIAKLHIKDFSRKKRDEEGLWKGFGVPIGAGDAGWPRVLAALDAVGYSTAPGGNWATAEVGGGDADRLREISRQMDQVLDQSQ